MPANFIFLFFRNLFHRRYIKVSEDRTPKVDGNMVFVNISSNYFSVYNVNSGENIVGIRFEIPTRGIVCCLREYVLVFY